MPQLLLLALQQCNKGCEVEPGTLCFLLLIKFTVRVVYMFTAFVGTQDIITRTLFLPGYYVKTLNILLYCLDQIKLCIC